MVEYITGLTSEEQERLYKETKGRVVGVVQGKPSYQEVQEIRGELGRVEASKEGIGEQARQWLRASYTTIEVSNIVRESRGMLPRLGRLPKGVQENFYTQLYILLKRESELVSARGVVVYRGHPDKYEIMVLELISKLGVRVIIENYGEKEEIEQMTEVEVIYKTGPEKEPIDEMLKRKQEEDIESRNKINSVAIRGEGSLEDVLEYVSEGTKERKTADGKYDVRHIEVSGVGVEGEYTRLLTEFKEELELNPRAFKILEQGIVAPTMIENRNLDTESVENGTIMRAILEKYPATSVEESIRLVELSMEEQSQGMIGGVADNFRRVMSIWMIRVLESFYKEQEMQEIPILVIWGGITEREECFIELMRYLPMDILHISPTKQQNFKKVPIKNIRVGSDKEIVGGYPRNTEIYRQKTQTYEAKEELQEVLYDGTMGLYKHMQFDRVSARIMRATYEDIKVMWEVPMRLRTPFKTRYGVVEVSNFFVQFNGVPQGKSVDEYKQEIRGYITEETVVLGEIEESREIEQLVRRTVFRDKVDYGKIMEAPEYRYGIYSERTQQTIIEKSEEMLELEWGVGEVQNLEYLILETILNLPQEIVQKQHAYTYTEESPKLLYFGSSEITESLGIRESIVMVFLALCGWDVMVISPAGYRYTERYIRRGTLDVIELGPYNFEVGWLESDKTRATGGPVSESLLGMLKNIFKK